MNGYVIIGSKIISKEKPKSSEENQAQCHFN